MFGDIPAWTLSGILPPYLGDPRNGVNMAPYSTTLQKVAERFASTRRRFEILQGLLAYRQALANLGIVDGFQWLNGSILEDIEKLENRDPNDIDIVTFFRRPVGARDPIAWGQFTSLNGSIFSPKVNKALYKCDTQYIDLDSSTEDVASLTRFWFGLFSHRRNDVWKGMLNIPLAISADDGLAQTVLAAKWSAAINPPPVPNP
jgi:hypothetical protein